MGCYTKESQEQNGTVVLLRQSLHPVQPGQAEARVAAGRYTLDEAADFISAQTNERKETILKKLANAAGSKILPTYAPGSLMKCKYDYIDKAAVVCAAYEEVYWYDLNIWLKENEPLFVCIFPNIIKDEDVPGATPAPKQERQDALAVELDVILSGMIKRTPSLVMAKLKGLIGKPYTCITANVGDGIQWESNGGIVKTLTIAALTERIRIWNKKKNTG